MARPTICTPRPFHNTAIPLYVNDTADLGAPALAVYPQTGTGTHDPDAMYIDMAATPAPHYTDANLGQDENATYLQAQNVGGGTGPASPTAATEVSAVSYESPVTAVSYDEHNAKAGLGGPVYYPPAEYAAVDYSGPAAPVDEAMYEDISSVTFHGTLERKVQLDPDGNLRMTSVMRTNPLTAGHDYEPDKPKPPAEGPNYEYIETGSPLTADTAEPPPRGGPVSAGQDYEYLVTGAPLAGAPVDQEGAK